MDYVNFVLLKFLSYIAKPCFLKKKLVKIKTSPKIIYIAIKYNNLNK